VTVSQLIFTCAGALLVLENQHWLWIGAHRDTYPNSFFDALYLSIMTATSVGYALLLTAALFPLQHEAAPTPGPPGRLGLGPFPSSPSPPESPPLFSCRSLTPSPSPS
jgi:hypothetical protein